MNLTTSASSVNDAYKTQTKENSRDDRFNAVYHRWRASVYENLVEAGLEKESELWLSCNSFPRSKLKPNEPLNKNAATVWVCSDNPHHDPVQFVPTCDCRFCPDCAARQTARLASRYVPVAKELMKTDKRYTLRHIVLTTPFSLGLLPLGVLIEVYKRLWTAISKLWKMLEKKNSKYETKGTIVAAEFGENGHKLHFHVIHYGRYIDWLAIRDCWSELTDDTCKVVHVGAISGEDETELEHNLIEAVKYSVKFWKRDKDGNVSFVPPELMPKLALLLKGTRRVRTSGVFYNIPEPENEPFCCSQCEAEMLRLGVEHYEMWQETGFFPEEFEHAARLNLILANKSVFDDTNKVDKPPPKQTQLPIFNKIPGIGINHYEQI